MKTQISKIPRLKLVLIVICAVAFTNCGRVNYKYYGVVYSKNNYPVPNATLYFEFMIGSKETNTDTRTVSTDNNGYY
ncbi:MAG: hypothetical protein IT236_09090, partial [Bacteroidia bacterium]|nr:hypothetical protein [Bacteroidia bacterium]